MKIISLKTKQQYDIVLTKQGENGMPCPECSSQRKKVKLKPFSFNAQKLTGYCQHCETAFVEFKPYESEKHYILPEQKNNTKLTDKALKFFTERGISQNTLNKLKIYSDNEYMPQLERVVEVICYPFFYNEKLINIKYRGANKSFKLVKDAELIFYNLDIVKGCPAVIIVEGENDLLAFVECGVENVISVPNGANNHLSYIDTSFELFTGKQIIIATDNDLKGCELKDELIRRFGSQNCFTVNFQDCKDANEYLLKYGKSELKKTIEDAKPIPISGIVNLENSYNDIFNMYLNGIQKGETIGVTDIDNICTWELGRVCVYTGIPSHGKSEVVDWFCVLLNLKLNWKVAYFSPENNPLKWHYRKIAEKIYGKSFERQYMTVQDFDMIFDYIFNNFSFIIPEDNFKLENILNKAEYLIRSKGIKILVIDPFNKIEHKREHGENETEYISRTLDLLINFAQRNNILIKLIVHPTKMKKNDLGVYYKPGLYEINGSANFYNKTDYGIVVYKIDGENPRVEIDFQKVKFKHLGSGGVVEKKYNLINGRYENLTTPNEFYDFKSYISIDNGLQPNIEFDNKEPDFLT